MRSPQPGERLSAARRMAVIFCCTSERSATNLRPKMLRLLSAEAVAEVVDRFADDRRKTAPDAGIAIFSPSTVIELVTGGRLKVTSSPAASKRMLISLAS